jgi:hypothetical protein
MSLIQKVLYWAPLGEDEYGGHAYGTPTLLMARWEDKVEIIVSPSNNAFTSKARVFTYTPVLVDGYLYMGDSSDLEVNTNPRTVGGAWKIETVTTVPNLSSLKRLTVAFV